MAGPALTVGNTFAYTAGGVSITPVWIDGTTAGVNVTVGTACVRRIRPPVAPVQQAGAAGTPLAYTVSVRNNDTGCGTSGFTLSVTRPRVGRQRWPAAHLSDKGPREPPLSS